MVCIIKHISLEGPRIMAEFRVKKFYLFVLKFWAGKQQG